MTNDIEGKNSARPAAGSTAPRQTQDDPPSTMSPPSNEFAEMLASSPDGRTPERGEMVRGTIVQIGDADALVDVGGKGEACIARAELLDDKGELTHKLGDEIEARVVSTEGTLRISRKVVTPHLGKDETREVLMEAFKKRLPVEGRVTASVKGGYEVQVAGLRGFCPFSQIDVRRQEEPLLYFNKTFNFRIKEYDPRRRNLILSRRALIEDENRREERQVRDGLTAGTVIEGTVVSLQDFGAFLDLGAGVQGLLHVSELSHARVDHPKDVLTVGQVLSVQILKSDRKKGKISLTRKPMEADPWDGAAKRFKVGQVIGAKVARVTEFGAFVELGPGLDGLVHVSELNTLKKTPDAKIEDIVKVGEELKVTVLKVEEKKRRVSLGVADDTAPVGDVVEIPQLKPGKIVTGKVERVEKFGVFLRLGPGRSGLIPNNELGTPRGSDHRRMFPIGTQLTAEIIETDPTGRKIRLSVSKAEGREEREAIERYRKDERKSPDSISTMADAFAAFRKTRET